MLAWLCNRVMAVSALDARAIVRASTCISTQWRAHPTGDHYTMSRPWHANIMNGLANEGLLIDYGENRVLLTQWWQLQGVLRHFVNALFFQSVLPRGSVYRPSDQREHHARDEVLYFMIFYYPLTCFITQIIAFFFLVHASININSANECVVHLAAGIHQAQPGVSASDESERGFQGFTLWAVVQWSRQKLLRWEVYVEGHCLWLTN